MDEAELGQLYVFDQDGAFVCVATDTTRLGVSHQEVAAKRKQHQKKVVAQVKDVLTHARRAYDTDKAVRDVYLDREQTAIDQAAGKVHRLPPREVLGTTPAIESARRRRHPLQVVRASPRHRPQWLPADADGRRQGLVCRQRAGPPIRRRHRPDAPAMQLGVLAA